MVEFAPGIGATARLVLDRSPRYYTSVERDEGAAGMAWSYLRRAGRRCVVGSAEATGLEDECASLVYGEARLTMQRVPQKRRIVGEAFRLLVPGGRYGIHELCLVPDGLEEDLKEEIRAALSETVRVGARPAGAGGSAARRSRPLRDSKTAAIPTPRSPTAAPGRVATTNSRAG